MKFISRISIVTMLLFFVAGSSLYAQGRSQEKKGQKGKPDKIENQAGQAADTAKAKAGKPDSLRKGQEAKGQDKGQGNAYGRNKADMSGREFGQARAAAAKKLQEDISRLETKVESGQEMAERAQNNIEQAEEELQESEADLSQEEVGERRQRIDRAKKQLSELETMIENQKAKLSAAKNKLETLRGPQQQEAEPDSTSNPGDEAEDEQPGENGPENN